MTRKFINFLQLLTIGIILIGNCLPASTNFLPKISSDDKIMYEYDESIPESSEDFNVPSPQQYRNNNNRENSLMSGSSSLQTNNLQKIEYDDGTILFGAPPNNEDVETEIREFLNPKSKREHQTNRRVRIVSPCKSEIVERIPGNETHEYFPKKYTEIICLHPYSLSGLNSEYHSKNEKCHEMNWKCIQEIGKIYLQIRRRDSTNNCWQFVSRDRKIGCDCRWPEDELGKLHYIN